MTKEERINKLLEWMKTATKSERHIPEIEKMQRIILKFLVNFTGLLEE